MGFGHPLRRRRQLLIDNILELAGRLRAGKRPAVDKEGRRTVHAQRLSFRLIGADRVPVLALIEAVVEFLPVQSELGGCGLEVGGLQVRLRLEQRVMELPELALSAGTAGTLRGGERVGMKREWEIH